MSAKDTRWVLWLLGIGLVIAFYRQAYLEGKEDCEAAVEELEMERP